MLENSERSVRGVRMGKSGPLARAELANQIQGFRIPDRWDASEKKKKCNIFKTLNALISELLVNRQRGLLRDILSPRP